MAVQAVVLKRHRKRQAPVRESMSSAVSSYASMLEMQKVIIFDLGIKHVDADSELVAKSFKLKVRMDGITCLKTNTAKAVQAGSDRSHMNFDTIGSTIYEGGKVLDFELCQSHCFASSQTVAAGQLKVETILQSMGKKEWAVESLDLLSLTTPGKVLATCEVQLGCRSAALRSAGGTNALKTMKVPTPPAHINSGFVFGFQADAQEVNAFVKKAGQAHERLKAAFHYAEKTVFETDSDCSQSSSEKKNRVSAKKTGLACERLEAAFHYRVVKKVVSETDSDLLLHETREAKGSLVEL
jgi:hypothetical protein